MKISFVIPSYNCVTWLPHAVTSCLQQTQKDIDVVVVDDGSTDRTWEYLEWLKKHDSRVQIIRNGKNLGRSESRNIGNRAAMGDVICVLDADDISTPNRAEVISRKFRSGRADFVYGAATVIDCLGRPSHVISPDVLNRERALEELQNRIVHSSVAYTREFAKKFPYRGGEIANLGIDDWAQQVEAMVSGAKFDFVPQRLCCYRVLEGQITRTRDEKAVLAAKRGFISGLKVPL